MTCSNYIFLEILKNVLLKTINTGVLSSKKEVYKARKIDDKLLLKYVKEHPDATLKEIAEEFSVCFQTI